MSCTIGGVTFDPGYEPPVPALAPRTYPQQLVHRHAGFTRVSPGRDHGAPVTIASSEHQGFLRRTQVDALIALYESGDPFVLAYSVGIAPSAVEIISSEEAIFDPERPPRFYPATPNGSLWACEMHFLVS